MLRRGRSYGPRIADPLVPDGEERGLHRRITGVPSFVHLVGGAYFFVPGLSALRWLATLG